MKRIQLFVFTAFLLSIICSAKDSFCQNVGIGITNPTRAKLEVNGAVGYTSAIFGGEGSGVSFQRTNPSIGFNQYFTTNSKYMSNGYASNFYLDPNNGIMGLDMLGTGTVNTNTTQVTRAFTVGNNGNISIKTINGANASLYVVKAGNFDGSAILAGTNYASYFNYSTTEDTYIRGGKDNSHLILNDIPGGHVIMGNGTTRVSINNGVPLYTLEIREANDHGIALISPSNGFDVWEIKNWEASNAQGNLFFFYNTQLKAYIHHDNGVLYSGSDSRLKTNVRAMPSLLDKVMQLRPVVYQMKDFKNDARNDHSENLGFIAQDVKKLFPQLVQVKKGKNNGYDIEDMHFMNYNGFGVLAIKAIQEQQQQIDELKKEVNELKQLIRSKQ
jgi:Chaperone of endosialidase